MLFDARAALADIRRERAERERAEAAIPAIPAILAPKNSGIARIATSPDAKQPAPPPVGSLFREGGAGWSGEDWRALFDERAGIAEFDGGLTRPQAEAVANVACLDEWRRRLRGPE